MRLYMMFVTPVCVLFLVILIYIYISLIIYILYVLEVIKDFDSHGAGFLSLTQSATLLFYRNYIGAQFFIVVISISTHAALQ